MVTFLKRKDWLLCFFLLAQFYMLTLGSFLPVFMGFEAFSPRQLICSDSCVTLFSHLVPSERSLLLALICCFLHMWDKA